jgi:hypothetical protein
MGDSDSGYQFGSGIGKDELARLEVQGRALAPASQRVGREARYSSISASSRSADQSG